MPGAHGDQKTCPTGFEACIATAEQRRRVLTPGGERRSYSRTKHTTQAAGKSQSNCLAHRASQDICLEVRFAARRPDEMAGILSGRMESSLSHNLKRQREIARWPQAMKKTASAAGRSPLRPAMDAVMSQETEAEAEALPGFGPGTMSVSG